jgi:hypothetical protein
MRHLAVQTGTTRRYRLEEAGTTFHLGAAAAGGGGDA